jgi:hypothetical protein
MGMVKGCRSEFLALWSGSRADSPVGLDNPHAGTGHHELIRNPGVEPHSAAESVRKVLARIGRAEPIEEQSGGPAD